MTYSLEFKVVYISPPFFPYNVFLMVLPPLLLSLLAC